MLSQQIDLENQNLSRAEKDIEKVLNAWDQAESSYDADEELYKPHETEQEAAQEEIASYSKARQEDQMLDRKMKDYDVSSYLDLEAADREEDISEEDGDEQME